MTLELLWLHFLPVTTEGVKKTKHDEDFHNLVHIHASVRQNHTDTQVFINEFEAAQEYIKDNEASH